MITGFAGFSRAGEDACCIVALWLAGLRTRHAKAFLKAQVNKSDRNDARGIAQMMRVGLFRPVHVKTLASQKRRALLAARKILQEKCQRRRQNVPNGGEIMYQSV